MQLQETLGMTFGDRSVELQLGKSTYKLLDERGLPADAGATEKEFLPYMPVVMKEMMWRLAKPGTSYAEIHFDAEHADWCAKAIGNGRCNCHPLIRSHYLATWIQTLTCAVCDESTTGEVGGSGGCEELTQVGVYKDHCRVAEYWQFVGDPYERWICDDCMRALPNYSCDVFRNAPDLKALARGNQNCQSHGMGADQGAAEAQAS